MNKGIILEVYHYTDEELQIKSLDETAEVVFDYNGYTKKYCFYNIDAFRVSDEHVDATKIYSGGACFLAKIKFYDLVELINRHNNCFGLN